MTLFAAVLLAAQLLMPQAVENAYDAGETLDYNLSWLRVTGGTARMTIAPAADDASRYRITSVAHSSNRFSRIFKVRDEIETTVARSDFSTLRYVKRLDEKGDTMQEVTTIEDGVATRTRKKVKKVNVPRPVFDPISVIYYLRTRDLAVGRSHDLTLIADGKVYTVRAHVLRRERIDTPAGTFWTVVVEPVMTSAGVEREERLWVWYTDDEKRIPVRIRTEIKVGSVTANLTRITPGAGAIHPPS